MAGYLGKKLMVCPIFHSHGKHFVEKGRACALPTLPAEPARPPAYPPVVGKD